MSKKEIAIVVLILVLIAGATVGGFIMWNHYQKWQVSIEKQKVVNATPATDNISLNSNSATSESNGLKVDTSANSSNPAQLGSGQSNSTIAGSTSASSSSTTAPGPETFKQYEQYKDSPAALFGDIQVGTGAEATANKKVGIFYKGWLTDGTLFDQSRADDSGKLQPFVFTVGARNVIVGMEQDIVGMKVGGTRRMIIPPAVGYGAQTQGNIPANSVMIFDVQLVAVE